MIYPETSLGRRQELLSIRKPLETRDP